MNLRSHIRLVAFSTCCFICSFASVRGDESSWWTLRSRVADDFSSDSRKEYQTSGDVSWREGEITLAEDATLGHEQKLGGWVETDVEFELDEPRQAGESAQLSMRLQYGSGVSVVWRSERSEGEIIHRLQVVHTTRNSIFSFSSQSETIREWTLDAPPSGKWRVSYRLGHLRIERLVPEPVSRFDAYAPEVSYRTALVRLSHSGVGCRLKGWRLKGSDFPPYPSSEQEADKARSINLRLKVQMAGARGRLLDPENLEMLQEARELRRRALGAEHPHYAVLLGDKTLGLLLALKGDFAAAEKVSLETCDVRKHVMGSEHPLYANSLSDLAGVYSNRSKYAEAIKALYRAREIFLRIYGPQSDDYLGAKTRLAGLQTAMGDRSRGERLLLEVLRTEKQARGVDDRGYAISATNLGMFYAGGLEFAKAEPLLVEAKNWWQRHDGKKQHNGTTALDQLADVYRGMGERNGGKEQHNYATVLYQLADVYRGMGEDAKAEALLLEACSVWKQFQGKDDVRYAGSLLRLGRFYGDHDRFEEAEALLVEARQIYLRSLGEEHPGYAAILLSLAAHSLSKGDTANFENYMNQARELVKRTQGVESRTYFLGSLALGRYHMRAGDFSTAELRLNEARKAVLSVHGSEHADNAECLGQLAELHVLTGRYAQAKELLTESQQTTIDQLGTTHPNVASGHDSFGELYDAMGAPKKADEQFRLAFTISSSIAESVIPSLPEAQALQWIGEHRPNRDYLLSRLRNGDDTKDAEAYGYVWATKSLVTRLRSRLKLPPDASPQATAAHAALRDAQLRLAQLMTSPAASKGGADLRQRLRETSERKERLENELAIAITEDERVTTFRPATPELLMNRLPPGVAVVDFVRTDKSAERALPDEAARKFWIDGASKTRQAVDPVYDAFILRRRQGGNSLTWVQLGDVAPIDKAVQAWRRRLTSTDRPAVEQDQQLADPADQLRSLVWKQIEPHLAGCRQVVVLPDGMLTRIPWAALPGRKPGSFLLEDYAIGTAGYGQQLYEVLAEKPVETGRLLIAGGVRYDDASSPPQIEGMQLAERGRAPAREKSRDPWPYLPATLEEARLIAALSPVETEQLLGPDATEQMVANRAAKARYVHLATHGFFASPDVKNMWNIDPRRELLFGLDSGSKHSRSTVAGRNPLLLSGVVLSGANLPPQTDELGLATGRDGILTGEEVTTLDLRNAELVTLSACETGLGDVAAGEGVFGLQRAFQQAGARAVVASLWKVDDVATQALMVEFYKNLWERKLGKLEALRTAQLKMLRSFDPQSGTLRGLGPEPIKIDRQRSKGSKLAPPYYWAAFQLSGDWR